MIWVGWRQQRTETIIAALVLAALAAVLLPTGVHMAAAYTHDHLARCANVAATPGDDACGQLVADFTARFNAFGNLAAWMTLVPGLVGVLLAAPFVGDLERRTYRLDWTQSITRARWIGTKLGLAAASAVVVAAVLTVLLTWWRAPLVHLHGRMDNSAYDSQGVVVAGYTLFALGVAAAIGAVWRRVGPSLVVGFLVYFGVRLFVDTWLRQRLVAPKASTWPGTTAGPDLNHAWVIQQYAADPSGRPLRDIGCPVGQGGGCRVDHADAGSIFMHAVYHPASHFWPLQLRELAIFLVLGAAGLAFAAWWTHERATS
jgi:hypothetical protein